MRAAKPGETPVVSVLMFVYNHGAYLEKAIRSVVGQTGDFPAEIIIHDDASTDGSRAIIENYARKYPDLIVPILQENNQMQNGVNIYTNYIYPKVRGKYLAYCEGDDYWIYAGKLELQIRLLETHPEYPAVFHNCIVVDAAGRRRPPVKKFYPFRKNSLYTLKELSYEARMPGQTASVVMRSSLLMDMPAGVSEQFHKIRTCVGDRQRTLLILLNGPALCLCKYMSAYRYVTESGTSWNARTRNKNLAGKYFMQETDFRRFAKEYFDTDLHNDFVLFGTGVMACLRYWRNPSEENCSQYRLAVTAAGGKRELMMRLITCFPGALLTLTGRVFQELRWRLPG